MRCFKLLILTIFSFAIAFQAHCQHRDFQFALVTDTHVGSSTAADDLRRTVADINANDSLFFVILSGDITEFGSDSEFILARRILDSLNKPWYIIPGNHDTKWSESGGNSFRRIFGSETFAFREGSFLFIGTNSGPNMRMSPGQIPRENIVWLDSLIKITGRDKPAVIYINHYPQDAELNNWFESVDRLKKTNIQLLLCGHGHANKLFTTEGIPSIMGRSNLRAGNETGGYNIMVISGDTLLTVYERHPLTATLQAWTTVRLENRYFSNDPDTFPRPDFSSNNRFPGVTEAWRCQEKSDIGCGAALSGKYVVTANTDGYIKAFDVRTGRMKWQYGTGAKIYSTPVIADDIVIEANTEGKVFALSLRSGHVNWTYNTGQRIVASPVIHNDKVYIAGSGGKYFSLSVKDGRMIWCNDKISGFVETIPLIYQNTLFFGTWDNRFYAIDTESGSTKWEWHNGYSNRMLSPAACVPVNAGNKIFVVAPDRNMTCLNALTGEELWRSDLSGHRVRESMGISDDGALIYAKTMEGEIIGVGSSGSTPEIVWEAGINIGYDIAPSVIQERNGIVFVASDKGFIYAFDKKSSELKWSYRISACLINQILPISDNSVVCTSMDGIIVRLDF